MKAPCKDCNERFLGCHGTCEKYKKYKEHIENVNSNKVEFHKSEDLWVEHFKKARKNFGFKARCGQP